MPGGRTMKKLLAAAGIAAVTACATVATEQEVRKEVPHLAIFMPKDQYKFKGPEAIGFYRTTRENAVDHLDFETKLTYELVVSQDWKACRESELALREEFRSMRGDLRYLLNKTEDHEWDENRIDFERKVTDHFLSKSKEQIDRIRCEE